MNNLTKAHIALGVTLDELNTDILSRDDQDLERLACLGAWAHEQEEREYAQRGHLYEQRSGKSTVVLAVGGY